jgi:hypothetical protein
MSDLIQHALTVIALVVLPILYLSLCVWMAVERVWWFTYVSYFIVFGTFGGWIFAFAMSPSSLTAASIVFLITVAFLSCVVSSLILLRRKNRTRFDSVAMVCGFSYAGLGTTYYLYALVGNALIHLKPAG